MVMSGFGQIQHTLCRTGVKHLTKSGSYLSPIYEQSLIVDRPEKDLRENTVYNYHVSAVRIRSEHCMGFLKGQWLSLRNLRLRINNKEQLKVATLWVITCIHLHCFAMEHEEVINFSCDQFYQQGLQIIWKEKDAAKESNNDRNDEDKASNVVTEDNELWKGKAKREELKRVLYDELSIS